MYTMLCCVVQALCAAGADSNARKSTGKTPPHSAADYDQDSQENTDKKNKRRRDPSAHGGRLRPARRSRSAARPSVRRRPYSPPERRHDAALPRAIDSLSDGL